MHSAVGKTMEYDMSKYRVRVTGIQDGLDFDFQGDMTDEEVENYAWSAIHNISTFYNHLQAWAEGNEPLREQIKAVNEGSEPLMVLRALDNKEKHPKIRGSKENLTLKEITRAARLRVKGKQQTGFLIGADGRLETVGDVSVDITASIVNAETGERIGELANTLKDGVETWEQFMRDIGLLR